MKFKLLTVLTLCLSLKANADQCVLSEQHLYKRVTSGANEMPVIPLAEALIDPDCPKLRDYTEVARAYASLSQQEPEPEKRIAASTGAVFTRDTSYPKLGKAYRDPSGLIWSDLLFRSSFLKQDAAAKACKEVGARLPTREEFRKLSEYLGKNSTKGYNPYLDKGSDEFLPGLMRGGKVWSSSDFNADTNPYNYRPDRFPRYAYVYTFSGADGEVGIERPNLSAGPGVRCVSGR